ncbi:MAG TPA: AGE family epimerase/isomerase, partial [Candidatus Limnocylindrales bacterium]|nr:AGE family epimerase/isomerase [Candidatus Limnocylindrales bacterium]
DQSLFLDTGWYRDNLINSADLWNGGPTGSTGMGTYTDGFNGWFNVALDRQWRPQRLSTSTVIAQSRAIYMNVEAYRAAGPEDGQRFLDAVNAGVDFLLAEFRDPEYGGFFWEVSRRGTVGDSMKQGYGNVHPLFALAQAYSVTQDPAHLAAVLEQLGVIEAHFLDLAYACALAPGFSRDYSTVIGVNNVDGFTHLFEALLALHDVTGGDTQSHVSALITRCGDFLVNTLYHDQDGFSDRGYVAYNYDEQWQPAQMPYTRATQWSGALHATTGHNIELAYLLSRAVERGFDPAWLDTADKLLRFVTEHALDPETGGMMYEITDYAGQPLPGNPDNDLYVWWAQAETARALLHFLVVRGREDYAGRFKDVEYLFNALLTDQEYGGLYQNLNTSLQPVGFDKGNIWKVNYHYSMLFAEVLRLAAQYPEIIAALNAP